MKLKWFLMLLVILLPTSLSANTLYFPQVAFGGGFSTSFVIINNGTTDVSSQVNFYGQDGTPRPDLTIPVNVKAGTTARYTLPNTGPTTTVVWGELVAGAGTVQGIATFDLRPGGTLVTTAGVLGLEANSSLVLPVDVTSSSSTGVAIATSSTSPVTVRLRLISADTTQTTAATIPFPAHGQIAKFVNEIFTISPSGFKGTLMIDIPGSSANLLVATALTLKEGILSALPVFPGTGGTGGTLDFPQVAVGGGFATNFTVINSGTTPVISTVNFYDQHGNVHPEFAQPVNLPPGGATWFVLADGGPSTGVYWAELETLTFSILLEGVASFDLRGGNGVLVTTAGVLGVHAGSSFVLPVDLTATGSTGVAIANASKSNPANVRLHLLRQDGSEVAISSDPRLSLGPHSQVADFVESFFPQLVGTTFSGALVVEATGATLSATALTVKEGILSALPVISGGAGGTGSGTGGTGGTGGSGGSGGGSGGLGGPGAASDCLNPSVYTSSTTAHVEYAYGGVASGTFVSDFTFTTNVPFQGNAANEWRALTVTNAGGQTTTTDAKTYGRVEGTDLLYFGNILNITTPLTGTSSSVYTPPFRDKRYSLGIGETWTTTYTSTTTASYTGLPTLPPTSTTTTYNATYLGRETVTVAAGTFTNACKFQISPGLIQWEAVGKGLSVRSVSTATNGQITTLELTKGTLNGSPLN